MWNEYGRVGPGNAIALIDDDQEMRAMLQDVLAEEGFEVHGFESASEYLRTAGAANRYFSLILSDVNMPGSSGIDLLRSLRESNGRTPVLLMTAAPNAADERAAQGLGVGAYMRKPFRLHELLTQVRATLAVAKAAASGA